MNKFKSCISSTIVIGFGLLPGLLLALPVQAESRWFDQSTVDKGTLLFAQNCASCHGEDAAATANWKDTNADGNYPPPPLNGSAHAWHHSKDLLKQTIEDGGTKIGGVMPGFKGKLSDTEIDAVIAFFQSLWPDEIYAKWAERYKVSAISNIDNVTTTPAQSDAATKDKITRLLKLRLGSDSVSDPVETPVSDIFQTQFGKNYAYLTADGRYLFMADLIDLEQEQNLTNNAKRKIATPAPKPLSNEVNGNAKTRKMTDLLMLRLGSKAIAEPVATPIGGIYQARFGVNYAYLTENGRYALIGNLIDLERGQNLTNLARQKIALDAIAQFPLEARAVFPASGEEKAVLNIFTDTSCAFCQKLHGEIANLQAAGISVHYLPYPREGTQGPGYQTLKQVWCASDRANAMTIAKGQVQGDLPVGDCTSAGLVDQGYALGNSVGISGTPALFKSNGEMIQGYVPSQQLIQQVLGN